MTPPGAVSAVSVVSVVVAAFDPGPYLAPCLESVLAQTCHDWECVVVDDGSTEDLAWVGDLDPRIRLVRQHNRGVHIARNVGAGLTTAPLLAFLDQDDLWRPDYLRRQLRQFDRDEVVLASTGFDIVDAGGAHVGAGFRGHNRDYADLLAGCGLHCGTVVLRRDAFAHAGGFRAYPISQDWDLWLRVLRDGGEAARDDAVLGSWRQHGSNASRDHRGLWRDARRILADHDHPAARQGRRRVRELSGVQAFDAARAARGRPVELARSLGWALSHAPRYTVRSLLRR